MKKERTFESSIKRLETIVSKLENGSESLETSLKLFEEGVKIAGFCHGIIDNAQQKIVDLSKLKLEKEKYTENENV